MTTDIPIEAAEKVAQEYGYDQIVIIGRKVGENGREHVTTYGADAAHCDVAARMGDYLKYQVMKWRTVVGFTDDEVIALYWHLQTNHQFTDQQLDALKDALRKLNRAGKSLIAERQDGDHQGE